MIKRILIPLDESEYTNAAIELGCILAGHHGAELTGLAVLDIPGIERSITSVPMGGMYYAEKLEKSREDEAKEQVKKMIENFERKCTDAGVNHRRAERQGNPSTFITEEARFYDVLIMGMRPHFSFKERTDSTDLFDVLDHSTTPMYAVPESIDFPAPEKEDLRAVIAYDGSAPATRALQRFALLAIPDSTEVSIVCSSSDEDQARFLMHEAAAYLGAHNIRTVKQEYTDKDIRDVLIHDYMPAHHMFVIGAHSKSAVGRFFGGSVTKRLLEADKRPVLIAH